MKLLLTLLMCGLYASVNAQILKKMADRAKQNVENKVLGKVDKTVDDAANSTKKKDGNNAEKNTDTKTASSDNSEKGNNLQAYSKFDFVPGEKVVAYEDFSNTNVGDFPDRWNTNATAEVVTLNTKPGKWLKIAKEGVWYPEVVTNLPENFTLEFDLGVPQDFDGSSFVLNIANLADREKEFTDFYHFVSGRHGHYVHITLNPFNGRTSANAKLIAGNNGATNVNNGVDFKGWDNATNNFAHVSLWRQNQRLRVYVNGEKIYDLPKAFEAGAKYNTLTYAMQGSYKPDEYYYLLGNIRLASGAADTRNKLVTEGKFVTHGILFDVASDKIKPESYGALKDIANVLKDNPDMKVKIVGHTDADGEDTKNLELSKQRAASVKEYLVKEFGVNADKLETDGKGELAPVDKNTTAEGKANNRRVEFIKA